MSDLCVRQEELEWESVVLGQKKFQQALEQGQSATNGGKAVVKASLLCLSEAIDAFVQEASLPKAGRKHRALPYLIHVLPEQAAYLTLRYAIDAASQEATMSATAIKLAAAVEDHINLVKLGDAAPGLYRKVMEQVKKSTSERHRTGVLRAVSKRYNVEHLDWSKESKVLLGTKLLELLEQSCDLIECRTMSEGRHNTQIRVVFTERAAGAMRQMNEREAMWTPVHLPMLVRPREWTDAIHGGYLSKAIRRAFLVQTHLPGALDEIKMTEMPAVLSAVNAIQSVPWRINQALFGVMEDAWAAGPRYEALFVEADQPVPARPEGIPEGVPIDGLPLDQKERLIEWKRRATDCHATNNKLRGKRASVGQKFFVARRFRDEKEFFFPHYLDFRGRIYPYASYLNPQSDDVGRAMLEFANGKPIGKRGLYWLKVHTANLFGVDKVSFEDRVKWVEDNLALLLDSAMQPLDGHMKWTDADSPWCALAACMELAGALVQGGDYVSHIPIAMDGSCSGLQHYSAMLRDPVGGAAVNLVPQEKPGDIYTAVAKRAQVAVDGSHEEGAAPWKGGKVVRKIAKQPTMTLCYSATQRGMQGQIQKALTDLGGEAYLGGADVRQASVFMAGVIWDCIGETVVAARDAMAFLKQIAKVVSDTGLPIHWTAPNGFPVIQAYKELEGRRVKIHYHGAEMQLMIQKEGERLNRRKQGAGVAPNFVHSLDSAHLMATVNLGVENGLTDWACIHDSFGCHAGDVDVLHACIREAFIEQYTPDVLGRLLDEVRARLEETHPDLVADLPAVPRPGLLDLESVRDSRYFFA